MPDANNDARIVEMVSAGQTKRSVAKVFGITPAQVDLAIKRTERRKRSEDSPYLISKISVRMAYAIQKAGLDQHDDRAILEFIFNPNIVLGNGLGKVSVSDAKKTALKWLEGRPDMKERQMNPIIEKVARAARDADAAAYKSANPGVDAGAIDLASSRMFESSYVPIARAAIRATLEHLKENVSDKAAFAGMLAIVGDKIDYGSDPDDAIACFKAVCSQAIAELDA